MKSLLILVLAVALGAALFLTRPHQADFEKFARDNKLTDDKPLGGPTLVDTISKQLQKFAAETGVDNPTDSFLKKCSYDNYFLWVNVNKDGKVIYSGAVGHWFQRTPTQVAAAPAK